MAWTAIGSKDAMKFDPGHAVRVKDRWIAVFSQRGADGKEELLAIDNACPHASAPLCDGAVLRGKVVCSLHLWEFDLRTGACDVGPQWNVRTYPVRVQGGEVEVDLPG
jgi:nitrite reductase (NADH) small subunit